MVIVNGVGVCAIIDNEPRPTLSVNDVTVTEGDNGSKDAVFTVSLSGPYNGQAGFSFRLSDGTAHAEEDFQTVFGGSGVPAGQTQTTISVPIIGGTITEPNETFFSIFPIQQT